MERIPIKISITCLIFNKVLLKVTTSGNFYRVAGLFFAYKSAFCSLEIDSLEGGAHSFVWWKHLLDL